MNNIMSVPTANVLTRAIWFGRRKDSGIESGGSGFAVTVDGDNYVVTAHHVAKGCEYKPHVRSDGQWEQHDWDVLADDADADVTVLRCIDMPHLGGALPLEYGLVRGAMHGQLGFAVGFPSIFDKDRKRLTGHISEIDGLPIAIATMLVLNLKPGIDASFSASYVNDGYSGGAMVYPVPDSNRWAFAGTITAFPTIRRHVLDTADGPPVGEVKQHVGLVRCMPWSYTKHLIEKAC